MFTKTNKILFFLRKNIETWFWYILLIMVLCTIALWFMVAVHFAKQKATQSYYAHMPRHHGHNCILQNKMHQILLVTWKFLFYKNVNKLSCFYAVKINTITITVSYGGFATIVLRTTSHACALWAIARSATGFLNDCVAVFLMFLLLSFW